MASNAYSVRRVVADVDGLALEKVRHEDLVLVLLVASCEDIGTLDGLILEAKDVVDDQESFLCIARTSGIGLHTVNGRVGAFGVIALANDGRNGTASLGLHCAIVSDELGMCCVVEEGASRDWFEAQKMTNGQTHQFLSTAQSLARLETAPPRGTTQVRSRAPGVG